MGFKALLRAQVLKAKGLGFKVTGGIEGFRNTIGGIGCRV